MVTLTYREQAALAPPPWEATKENVELCRKALRGEAVPHDLLRYHEARRCVIYGIRLHLTFATSAEVTKLCEYPENADFSRARNARFIMSNQLPELKGEETYPYCIWFPEVASEAACRKLAEEHPALRYHIGRACAVAGYVGLYRELHLLPDVSIAEEARDNGCTEIYEDIVGSAVRYAVMDDATRSLNLESPRKGVFLNGESQVRSFVDADSRKCDDSRGCNFGYRPGSTPTFDIIETGGITGDLSETNAIPLKSQEVKWLYSPLPLDMPTTNKDLLILMAAYEGNVDRYARLRRPKMISDEYYCVIRGIYHSTIFARWWIDELAANDTQESESKRELRMKSHGIREAINARLIMCNSLELVSDPRRPGHICHPYMIWYPLFPREKTLGELARRIPAMRQSVAHACIAADYQALYDTLDITPHAALYAEARNSSNGHYQEDLESRAAAQGIDLEPSFLGGEGTLQVERARRDKEPTSTWLYGAVGDWLIQGEEEGIYESFDASSKFVDLFLCSSERLREQALKFDGGWAELYETDYDKEGNEHRLGVEGAGTDAAL